MTDIISTTRTGIVPVCRTAISIRVATLADIPFFDRMQKQFGKQLGYFPTKQFEGYVEMGAVLVAEEKRDSGLGTRDSGEFDSSVPESRIPNPESRLGYVISRDRYLKRDELGVIYQLCVAPGTQRKLVGATLIAEVFKRSAYGCKLYCCWCAQDIEANYFWESLGFVPIAFRAGSAKKSRVHIFWQRRINGADEMTPWWYPSATNGGAIREDRLVFPIPPGVHWKDVTAVAPTANEETKTLTSAPESLVPSPESRSTRTPKAKRAGETPAPRKTIERGGLFFAAPKAVKVKEKKAREPRAKVKNDPVMAGKAREFRDRWMETVNQNPQLMVGCGKYEVGRELGKDEIRMLNDEKNAKSVRALPAAA